MVGEVHTTKMQTIVVLIAARQNSSWIQAPA